MSGASPIDLTPSDAEPTPAELAAAGTIRPLEELPSPWIVTGTGTPSFISQPTLSALSPTQRQTVLERAGSSDPGAIDRALNDFLLERSREVRIMCGPGEGATETERTATDQVNQLRLLGEECARIEAELAEVAEFRQENGADGNPVAVPVHRYQGDARTARMARLELTKSNMVQVAGLEGKKELDAATRTDALNARSLRQQAEESAEIERMGEALLRAERVGKAAEMYAKHRRSVIG